ncbi:hypothetical protein PR202_ga22371 [Eleusine coracana subsp. coracana]|uniref:Uncharacterized protein n=1 Tax=Eleusine coracana subsp. coracana TaxID=191504 RepID=A0AAV5D3G6_ELECO|nr:hypothetical protein PR202_ga22371 [Eleusine coracana subsp. coracana]
MASVIPGHTRLPAPNGIILISLVPVRSILSPSPPGMNRSGEKDIGLDQTSGFRLILPTRKFTVVPPRGRRDTPSALAASLPSTWRITNGIVGWRRMDSSTTALRYGMRERSASSMKPSPPQTTELISARSFV